MESFSLDSEHVLRMRRFRARAKKANVVAMDTELDYFVYVVEDGNILPCQSRNNGRQQRYVLMGTEIVLKLEDNIGTAPCFIYTLD